MFEAFMPIDLCVKGKVLAPGVVKSCCVQLVGQRRRRRSWGVNQQYTLGCQANQSQGDTFLLDKEN
jgi:hypothetical protein